LILQNQINAWVIKSSGSSRRKLQHDGDGIGKKLKNTYIHHYTNQPGFHNLQSSSTFTIATKTTQHVHNSTKKKKETLETIPMAKNAESLIIRRSSQEVRSMGKYGNIK